MSSEIMLSCSKDQVSSLSRKSLVTTPTKSSPSKQLDIKNWPNILSHVKPDLRSSSTAALQHCSSDASRNPTTAPPRSNNATLNLPPASLRVLNSAPATQSTTQTKTHLNPKTQPQKWSTPSSSTSTPRMMPRASPSSSPSCKRRARSTPTTRRLLVGEWNSYPGCEVK